jgi:P-type E1-E2 ATPase
MVESDPHLSTKTNKVKVLTITINEELAAVKYIFSDKTGTLT